ncbi:MAG TPA: YibE/F family protein [Planctomycetota bacterium]|nr:YibE/F family protein [Planctomycetota bacterium]
MRRAVVAGASEGGARLRVESADGKTLDARYSAADGAPGRLGPGRRVFIEASEDGEAVVVGVVRDRTLLFLAGVFLTLFALVAGRDWLGSIAGLVAAVAGVVFVLPPLILWGMPPQAAGLLTAAVLSILLSLLLSGIRRRTLAICIGCLGGLLLTFVVSVGASSLLRFTGVYSAPTTDLWATGLFDALFLSRLLSAGIVIGALGVAVDLSTGVASAVFEVADAQPLLPAARLIRSGLQVGRDVLGTELNTLAFAYAGVHVGLLLLPFFGPRGYELPFIQVVSSQEFAVECAHVAAGTAGLMLTIPLTAIAAGMLASRKRAQRNVIPTSAAAGSRALLVWAGAFACWTLLAGVCLWFYSGAWHCYDSGSAKRSMSLVRVRAEAASPAAEQFSARTDHEQMQTVTARAVSGPLGSVAIRIQNPVSGFPGHDKLVSPGDSLLVKTISSGGTSVASIIDFDRGPVLLVLVWLVGALAMLVGGLNGVRALLALGLSSGFLGAAVYLVADRKWPALPTLAAAALLICGASFPIIAGVTRKALSGACGAFAGSLIGGCVAAAAAAVMGFSGLQSDSLYAIRSVGGRMDFAGLLSGGILLGIVGVAMDVAMAVASSADEITRAKPTIGRLELWHRGMSVGRRVMCTMVLALVFAYLGASLPLLILPRIVKDVPLLLLLNSDRFAGEALRILAGGIGVVVTIPATALLSSLLQSRRP